MEPGQIREYFESRRDPMIDLIRQIVEIESPSRDSRSSRLVADWIEEQAQGTGVDISIERVAVNDGDHLVMRAFPARAKHTMLLGHTDTVHPTGAKQHNPTRIEGDRFYGCGIFDMKANIVLMLEALRYFAAFDQRPPRAIATVLSCDEEVGSFTGREIVEREAAGAERCFVLEPSSDGMVKTGRKGTGMFTVRTHGVPAHAGLEPEKGANAVAELARQVEAIHAIARPDMGTTVNVTTFHGGTTLNVIPEHAVCEVDVRFSSMDEADRIDREVRSLSSVDGRVTISIAGGINRPPLERTDKVVGLYSTARDLSAGFGYHLGETQVGGGSDGNFVAALGVPVLDGLGVSGAGAHTLNEHILVSDIASRATLITLLLANT